MLTIEANCFQRDDSFLRILFPRLGRSDALARTRIDQSAVAGYLFFSGTISLLDRGPRRSWMDVERGLFHRLAEGARATDKRQPPVRLSPVCPRWKKKDGDLGHVVTFAGAPIASVNTARARACKIAELGGGVTAYTLRHTCASWLVSKGVSIWETTQFLGTSPAMIERHYGHHAPDYLRGAAEAIGRK